ncbi:MAG TPA: substrate-binding domain-containing protein, partial [Bacteroidales bacterium]|nr:substrate-binding domain-containing protein [Bacteroidales bacterium]
MKNTIVLFIGLLLLNCSIPDRTKEEARNNLSADDSINIFCTPDLYNLTARWASEFCNINPDVKIKVINVTESSVAENLNINRNLGFISGEYSAMHDESTWKVVVGRNVIVPIFNSKNPFVNEICQQGISPEELAQIFKNPEMKNWGTLLNNQKNVPINFYMIDDPSINSGMSKLLNVNQIMIDGIKAGDGKELISSVQNDIYSIGICKIANILDPSNQSILEGVKLLPIDRNGNGKIDYMEEIYDDLNVLSRGIWIGKYPRALSDNIYSVSTVKPTNRTEVKFLNWVLTDGQQFLNNYGYNDLVLNERLAKLNLLDDYEIGMTTLNNNYAISKEPLSFYIYLPIILTAILVMVIMVISGVQYIKDKKADVLDKASVPRLVFNEDFVKSPPGLYYDKTHTWAFMEKDGMVRIGIDDFLQHITGPLTRVRMKNPGEKIRKGKQILSIIQNGKQLNIYTPVSGTIKEQNKALDTNTSVINSSPYSEGWVYMIEPTNWLKEIQFFL